MKEALAEVADFKIGGVIDQERFADDTSITAKTQHTDVVSRLVDIGKKYGMEINIDKSQ